MKSHFFVYIKQKKYILTGLDRWKWEMKGERSWSVGHTHREEEKMVGKGREWGVGETNVRKEEERERVGWEEWGREKGKGWG